MALRVTKVLVDDMDNTPESEKPVKTRRFTMDGTQYEIDLNDDNHAALRAAVAEYVQKARVISRPKAVAPSAHGVAGSKKQQARIDRAQIDHMREWLRSHGDTVSPYGRIPVALQEKYRRYHDTQLKPTATPETNGHEVSPPMEGNPLFQSA